MTCVDRSHLPGHARRTTRSRSHTRRASPRSPSGTVRHLVRSDVYLAHRASSSRVARASGSSGSSRRVAESSRIGGGRREMASRRSRGKTGRWRGRDGDAGPGTLGDDGRVRVRCAKSWLHVLRFSISSSWRVEEFYRRWRRPSASGPPRARRTRRATRRARRRCVVSRVRPR